MISQIRWIKESGQVRNYLAGKFDLPVGNLGSEMAGGILVSDGRTPKQLYEAFTVKKLQAFTGSELTDVNVLFDVAVEIAKAELGLTKHKKNEVVAKKAEGKPEVGPADAPTDGVAAKVKGRRGRPKKTS